MKINCTEDVKNMLNYSGIFEVGFFSYICLKHIKIKVYKLNFACECMCVWYV